MYLAVNSDHRNQNSSREQPVGIDLGTTYSAIASIDETGRPYCIPNEQGEYTTPTALLVDVSGLVVGREAVQASVMEPHDYADCFKRDMGSAVFRRGLHGTEVPPEVLNGFVLRQLKEDAQRTLGDFQQAVITVPAFFDESRRKATQDAGGLAGLDVIDIINEPTAAALAFGFQSGLIHASQPNSSSGVKLLVYDLGGGTFDVTILEINDNTYRTLATDGDVKLGGRDFDERIVDYLAEYFIKDHGIDPRSDPNDAAQLWLDAERSKQTLSQRSKTNLVVSHAGVRSRIELSRQKFEELTQDLIARTQTTTEIVLRTAGFTWNNIDRVLLVGGSSRIPAVSEMLRQLSGIEPDRSLAPDQAVAHGAAIHAAILKGHSAQMRQCKLVNVNSHSLGVKGYDAKTKRYTNSIMIPKNSSLPCKRGKIFRTRESNQPNVRVTVLEGESLIPSECIELGECVIRDLPPNLPAGSKIEVHYEYGADGRVSVKSKVLATRQSTKVDFYRKNNSEIESLDRWEKRLLSSLDQSETLDVGNALRQLDLLYQKLGENLLVAALPETLRRAQSLARESFKEWKVNRESLLQAENLKKSVKTHADLIQISSKLARLRGQHDSSLSQAKYALVVLGRDCFKHSAVPKAMQGVSDQIAKLREFIQA